MARRAMRPAPTFARFAAVPLRLLAALLLCVVLAACGPVVHRDARVKFNEGLAALAKGEFEAAQKALLDARSDAGVDPELRFRAAYELGLACAAHSEKVRAGEKPDLQQALDLADRAASWFTDALRLRPGDTDTASNLAVIRARVQALNDELRKDEGRLEARLDAVIADQRKVLDETRGSWLAIRAAGGTDPLSEQGTLTRLADRERAIVAEAGVVSDLASDESDAIGRKPEAERTDEERARSVQLADLGAAIDAARARIGEARRKLQELAARDAVARAEAALVALKRAREQLLDPVTVLRNAARDQMELLAETGASAGGGPLLGAAGAGTQEPEIPVWLDAPALAERQTGIRERVDEVRARLEAFVEHAKGQGAAPAEAQPEDPERAKLAERVGAAVPHVLAALASMRRAADDLAARRTKDALEPEEAALRSIARAVEEFVDLKNLVEIAHGQQEEITALLSDEAAKELAPAERGRRTRDGVDANLARMTRLRELIAEESAKALEEAAKAAQGGAAPSGPDPKADEERKKTDEAIRQRFELAERLRSEAGQALDGLRRALGADENPRAPAALAAARIEELRRLFFSVEEHLEQLIRDQGETADRTSATRAEDASARDPKVPALAERQEQHGEIAKAITEVLATRADEAAKAPPEGGAQGPSQGPGREALSAAVEEMRLAEGEIRDANGALARARDPNSAEAGLADAAAAQGRAIEHLVAARRHLDPPKKDEKDPKQDPSSGGAGPQPSPQEKKDPQRPGGAAQQVRDEDARRQRERQARAAKTEPVEKDW